MDALVLLIIFPLIGQMAINVPCEVANEFLGVWRDFHGKKRSIATAIAFTCILAAFPVICFEIDLESKGLITAPNVLGIAGMILLFGGGGILGAVGLVWDRMIAKRESGSVGTKASK